MRKDKPYSWYTVTREYADGKLVEERIVYYNSRCDAIGHRTVYSIPSEPYNTYVTDVIAVRDGNVYLSDRYVSKFIRRDGKRFHLFTAYTYNRKGRITRACTRNSLDCNGQTVYHSIPLAMRRW